MAPCYVLLEAIQLLSETLSSKTLPYRDIRPCPDFFNTQYIWSNNIAIYYFCVQILGCYKLESRIPLLLHIRTRDLKSRRRFLQHLFPHHSRTCVRIRTIINIHPGNPEQTFASSLPLFLSLSFSLAVDSPHAYKSILASIGTSDPRSLFNSRKWVIYSVRGRSSFSPVFGARSFFSLFFRHGIFHANRPRNYHAIAIRYFLRRRG